MISEPRVASPPVEVLDPAPFKLEFQSLLDSTEPGIEYCASVALTDVAGSGATLYLGQFGLATRSDDTPAAVYFQPRLVEPLAYRRTQRGRRLGGRRDFRGGEIVFECLEPVEVAGVEYDLRSLLQTFSPARRQVEVRAVQATFAAAPVLFRGRAVGWERVGSSRVRVILAGTAAELDKPLAATYKGTGDLEGTEDLKDLPRPVALGGKIFNAQPTLVIPEERLYEVHTDADGAGAEIESFDEIRIGGIKISVDADHPDTAALRAADVRPGYAETCRAEGRFRIGSEAGATITVDLKGAVSALGNTPTLPGQLFTFICNSYGGVPLSNIDGSTTSLANRERPYELSRYVSSREEARVSDILDEIANSTETTWGDDPSGMLRMGVVERPAGGEYLDWQEWQIRKGSVSFTPLPQSVLPAISEVIVRYGRNYTPDGQITEGVEDDTRSRLQTDWLTERVEQTLARAPEAKTLEVETLISEQADAAAFAALLASLYDGSVELVEWDAMHRGITARLGLIAEITAPVAGLSAERVRIAGIDVSLARQRVRLTGIASYTPQLATGNVVPEVVPLGEGTDRFVYGVSGSASEVIGPSTTEVYGEEKAEEE